MTIFPINYSHPLKVNQIKKLTTTSNIPKYKIAYVPTEIYDQYCTNGYCYRLF